MYLSCAVLILATFWKENACNTPLEVLGLETAAELAKLINLVNRLKGNAVASAERERAEGSLETEHTMMVIPDRDEGSTQTGPDARLHHIHNPSVLHEYQNTVKAAPKYYYIRNPKELKSYEKGDEIRRSTTDDGETDSSIDMTDNILQRRNAVFRFDGSSNSENTQRHQETINNPRSLEQDKYFRKRDKPQHNDFDNSQGRFDEDVDHNQYTKKGQTEDPQDNAWDVITKKYNWEDERKPKDKYNDDIPDKRSETREKFKKNRDVDDWDKKSPKQGKQKRFNKAERQDWDQKITKQDNYNDWDTKVFKPEKSHGDWPKRNKGNSGEKQSTKRHKWNSGERNKPVRNDNWDSGERNRPMKKNKWNSDEHKPIKKVKYPEFNSGEKPKRNRDSFDEVATIKSTRKWTRGSDDWKNAPAQTQYNKPKRSRLNLDSGGGGFYGRTPIPFVGKKGIYEETS